MSLGNKIKSYRAKLNLTQKDLADQVNVTAQAISRWEQDIVEPSIGTLKQLARIFSTSIDDLLSNQSNTSASTFNTYPTPIIIQQESPQTFDQRRTIGVCEHCNRAIIEGDKIHRHSIGTRSSRRQLILCETCNQARETKIHQEYVKVTRKNRFWGFFWGLLFGGYFLYAGIQGFLTNTLTNDEFLIAIVLSYMLFSFFFTFTMNNNFIKGFFWDVTSFGFIRLPGIIFSFDIDGLIFLLTAKVVLFFIAIGIAIFAGGIALILSLLLAGFVMPFSMFNAFTNPRKTELF